MGKEEQYENDKKQYYNQEFKYEPVHTNEFLQDEQEPHYIQQKRKLINTFILDLERLSGFQFPLSGDDYIEPAQNVFITSSYNSEHFVPRKIVEMMPPFLQEIVNAGRKKKVKKYIKEVLDEIELRLKENGNVTPTEFEDIESKVGFWDYSFWHLSSEYEGKRVLQQRLEVERLFRKWLKDVQSKLLLTQENNEQGEPARGLKDNSKELKNHTRSKIEYTFDENFRDYLNGRSEMAERIMATLQEEGIVDSEGIWQDDPMDIRGLYLVLIEISEKFKLKDSRPFVLYRICHKKFRLKKEVPESSRNNGPVKLMEKYRKLLNSV